MSKKKRRTRQAPGTSPIMEPLGDIVTIAELARRTGMTEAAIRGRIHSGDWVQGVHYFRKGRRLMMRADVCARFWVEAT